LNIELRGSIPVEHRPAAGTQIFGCDICQDVCPWNRRAAVTVDARFTARNFAPPLEKLAAVSSEEFRSMFAGSPVMRTKYAGFLRNVAVAMGNTGNPAHRHSLERLAQYEDPTVAEHARWGLEQLAPPTMEEECDGR